MPCLFIRQHLRQRQQFLEYLLDIAATRVIALDELLELRQIVGTGRIESHHVLKLCTHRSLQPLDVCIAGLLFLEALAQRLKVDLGKIDLAIGRCLLPNLEWLCRNGVIKQILNPLQDVGNIRRVGHGADAFGYRGKTTATL